MYFTRELLSVPPVRSVSCWGSGSFANKLWNWDSIDFPFVLDECCIEVWVCMRVSPFNLVVGGFWVTLVMYELFIRAFFSIVTLTKGLGISTTLESWMSSSFNSCFMGYVLRNLYCRIISFLLVRLSCYEVFSSILFNCFLGMARVSESSHSCLSLMSYIVCTGFKVFDYFS